MGEIFANPLWDLAEYSDMKRDLDGGRGPVHICGVTDSQKVHVMHEVSTSKPWKLVVTHDDTRARELYDDFSYFCKKFFHDYDSKGKSERLQNFSQQHGRAVQI